MNTNSIQQDLLNQLSDENTIVNSFSSAFDFDYNTNTFESSWANTVQTVTDPYLTYGGKVTVDKNFLPIEKMNADYLNLSSITAPPNYLTAEIILYRSGDEVRKIPILFDATISNSISANYTKEHPIGSSNPIVAFNYTGEETFPFSFVALADYLPTGFNTLRSYIDAIKEMVKPSYSDSIVKSPYVLLNFADISVKCICESISINYDNIYNSDNKNGSFAKANIQCQFTKIRD